MTKIAMARNVVIFILVLAGMGYFAFSLVNSAVTGVDEAIERQNDLEATVLELFGGGGSFEDPNVIDLPAKRVEKYFQVRRYMEREIAKTGFYDTNESLNKLLRGRNQRYAAINKKMTEIREIQGELLQHYIIALELYDMEPGQYAYAARIIIGVFTIEITNDNFTEDIAPEDRKAFLRTVRDRRANNARAKYRQTVNKLMKIEQAKYDAAFNLVAPHVREFIKLKQSLAYDFSMNDLVSIYY